MGQPALSDSSEIAQSDLTRPAGHNMLAALLFSLVVGDGGQAHGQGVDIEVLSHICKFGVHSDGRRYSETDSSSNHSYSLMTRSYISSMLNIKIC